MGIHFSHRLGIVWIPASHEISKKSIPLECLCFVIFFPYYGNSIYPCFGNYVLEIVWIFASREIFKKFIILECWCFPIYVRNPDFGMFFFPTLFSYYRNSLSPCFGDNTSDAKTIPIVFSLKTFM